MRVDANILARSTSDGRGNPNKPVKEALSGSFGLLLEMMESEMPGEVKLVSRPEVAREGSPADLVEGLLLEVVGSSEQVQTEGHSGEGITDEHLAESHYQRIPKRLVSSPEKSNSAEASDEGTSIDQEDLKSAEGQGELPNRAIGDIGTESMAQVVGLTEAVNNEKAIGKLETGQVPLQEPINGGAERQAAVGSTPLEDWLRHPVRSLPQGAGTGLENFSRLYSDETRHTADSVGLGNIVSVDEDSKIKSGLAKLDDGIFGEETVSLQILPKPHSTGTSEIPRWTTTPTQNLLEGEGVELVSPQGPGKLKNGQPTPNGEAVEMVATARQPRHLGAIADIAWPSKTLEQARGGRPVSPAIMDASESEEGPSLQLVSERSDRPAAIHQPSSQFTQEVSASDSGLSENESMDQQEKTSPPQLLRDDETAKAETKRDPLPLSSSREDSAESSSGLRGFTRNRPAAPDVRLENIEAISPNTTTRHSEQPKEILSQGHPAREPEDLFSQVVQQIKMSSNSERGEVRIQLKPEHFGELRIKISVSQGIVTAEFSAESQVVKEIIGANLQQLRSTLQEMGINVGELSVDVSGGNPFGGDGQQSREPQNTEQLKLSGTSQTRRELTGSQAEHQSRGYYYRNGPQHAIDLRA